MDKSHYYSLNEYLKDTFHTKVYKLALNGGMSCPNRDGLIDTRGCIFCSRGGSGDFAGQASHSITEQIESQKAHLTDKYKGHSYIAYFQAYTNTYAPVSYLRQIFTEAINHPDIVAISIGTRPDCLQEPIIELLKELNAIKPVWIELGLQTIHERTEHFIRRGYPLSVFEDAVLRLQKANITTIVHMIIGLPGESTTDILDTARYLAHCNIQGIKLQLLHVLCDTDLGDLYDAEPFKTFTLEEYCEILGNIIELLPPDMVIHRLTGDGPKRILIAPQWSANKKYVLNTINHYFSEHDIMQGKHYVI